MIELLRLIVKDYGWIHGTIGLVGNCAFFIGSIFFLPDFEAWKTAGVWLFIGGSLLMLVGAAGDLAVKFFDSSERRSPPAS
ncbi:hypothetical protein D6851_04915 [Altericroceibacterium spongiae]|uniref:YrhK domain-containing protein n=1 Tax=Altericroceibacterium spongiae TaxID=2320269 RepID=A0A420EPG1_9SPHN|nr:YrhK family protein [Altericroceibacterium spongiae]RKF22562.1 hypothetical protein D6851_04915 [Altericroceibacterium spongiae]